MALDRDKIWEAAQGFIQRGMLDKAVRELERIAKDDPNDIRSLLKLAELEGKKSDPSKSIPYFLRAAQVYVDQGFGLKAVSIYKQILAADPNAFDVAEKLAGLYESQGLLSDACTQYDALLSAFHERGNQSDILRILEKLVAIAPDEPDYQLRLATRYQHSNQITQAKDSFLKASQQLFARGRIEAFTQVAETTLRIDPSLVDLSKQLAHIYIQSRKFKEALICLRAPFRAEPHDPETLLMLSDIFVGLDKKAKALLVLHELGAKYLREENLPGYRDTRRLIGRIEPSDPEFQQTVREWGSELESNQETVNSNDRIQNKNSFSEDDIDTWMAEAEIYAKYRLYDKAAEKLEYIVSVHPSHIPAIIRLKEIYISQDNTEKAIEILWQLVQIAHRSGRSATTKDTLRELLSIHPSHAEAKELLQRLEPQEPLVEPMTEIDGLTFDIDFTQEQAVQSTTTPVFQALEEQIGPIVEPMPEVLQSTALPEDHPMVPVPGEHLFDDARTRLVAKFGDTNPLVNYHLGIAYYGVGQYDAALEALALAVSHAPLELSARTARALCFLAQYDAQKALEELFEALLIPTISGLQMLALRFEIACTYESMKQWDLAHRYFDQVAQVRPEYRDVQNRLEKSQALRYGVDVNMPQGEQAHVSARIVYL